MSTVRINVGGKVFEATRATWSKCPVLDKLICYNPDSLFVDRSPEVFNHILDWLREGKLYIDCPSNHTYKRLCADADFYGLEDLSRFLANRINLCSRVYFKHTAYTVGILCNLDAFRTLEPADGFIDRLLAGDPAALARITFVDADTVLLSIDLTKCRDALLRPHIGWMWKGSIFSSSSARELTNDEFKAIKPFFGSRLARVDDPDWPVHYRPVPRAETKD